MMVILFVLGMFLDWVGILLLTVPIFLPIMKSLEWGGLFGLPGVRAEDVPLWYGVIFMVNMQMAFLSPPFGYSLFYLKSVAPPEITHGDDLPLGGAVHRPAVARRSALCIVFPGIVLWLPQRALRRQLKVDASLGDFGAAAAAQRIPARLAWRPLVASSRPLRRASQRPGDRRAAWGARSWSLAAGAARPGRRTDIRQPLDQNAGEIG